MLSVFLLALSSDYLLKLNLPCSRVGFFQLSGLSSLFPPTQCWLSMWCIMVVSSLCCFRSVVKHVIADMLRCVCTAYEGMLATRAKSSNRQHCITQQEALQAVFNIKFIDKCVAWTDNSQVFCLFLFVFGLPSFCLS